MSNEIKMQLQAELQMEKSIANINKQLKQLTNQVSVLQIKTDIDKDAAKSITNISKNINQATKGNIKYNETLQQLIHSYKTQQISAQDFVKSASKYREITEFANLSQKEQLQLVSQLTKAEKEHTAVLKEKASVEKRIANEQAKIQDKVISFQQKMLGGDNTGGQMDIFASKYRGKYNINVFNDIKRQIESLPTLPLEEQSNRVNEINIQWSNLKQTVTQSGSVFTRTVENMGKFLRFYLAGGVLVGFVRDMKQGITFIKELDKELTQVSIVQGLTRKETLELAKSYSVLGQDMGKTVTEISKINTELIRQGLSLEKSQDRMDKILKLSATSGIDTAQAMEIITSSVNALGEEAERTADVLLKTANISASDVGQLGEGFTRVASSAKATGMELTELSSILAVLIEVTQESPNSLGNSLKSLLARFNKINEETGEVNEHLNAVQKAFESVGITFLDAEGQIRPVFDLLQDLNKIWAGLDKNTKMYIATQSAGTLQQNRFLAIMDNFGRVLEVNNDLMNSSGVLNEAYSIYLDSVEASANKAKAALEQVWINAISSDSIKMFYDASASILNLIDKVGLLNIALTALIFSFVHLKKSATSNWIFTATRHFTAFAAQVKYVGLNAATATIGMNALTFATKTFAAVKTLGISLAITGLITLIGKAINSHKELERANQELIQSHKEITESNSQNINRLQDVSHEYDNIRRKIESHIELSEEEKRILDDIIAINPAIVKGYDERGQAIIDTTQSIDKMIEALQRANEIEDIKLMQGGLGLFKEAKKNADAIQKDIERINRQIEQVQFGGIVGTVSIDGLDQMTRRRDELLGLQNSNVELSAKEQKELDNLTIKIKENEMTLKSLNAQARIYQTELQGTGAEVKNALFAQARLTDSYKNLTDEGKKFVSEYITGLNTLNFETWIDAQISVDNFINALSNANFNRIYSEYVNLVKEFEDGSVATQEFDEKLQKLITRLLEIEGIDEDLITKIFKDPSAIEDVKKQAEGLNNIFGDLTTHMKEAEENLRLLDKAQQELDDTGQLSVGTLGEMVGKFSEFIDIQDMSIDTIYDFIKAKQDEQTTFINTERAKTNELIKSHNERLELYKSELEALKGLMTAQATWASIAHYDNVSGEIWNIEQAIADAQKRLGFLDYLEKSFVKRGATKSTPSKSSSTEPYKATADAYLAIANAIAEVNNQLDKNKSKLSIAEDQDKINLLKQQNELYKQQQNNVHQLAQSYRLERAELEKYLSGQGFKFSGEGDKRYITNLGHIEGKTKEVEEAFKRYNDLVTKEIPAQGKDWLNLRNAIADVGHEIEFLKLDGLFKPAKDGVESLTKEMDLLEFKFKMIEDTNLDGKMDILSQKLINAKAQVGFLANELVHLKSVGFEGSSQAIDEYNKRLEDLEKQHMNAQLLVKSINDQMMSDYKQQVDKVQSEREKIADNIIKVIQDAYRKQREIVINTLNQQLKAEEKIHKRRIEMLDEQLSKYEEIIQTQLDAIDRQEDEDSFNKELKKMQDERAEIIKNINILSMDDSLEARNRVSDLHKKLTEQDQKIEEFKHKRTVDLRKQNLKDELNSYKKQIDEKKKTEENNFQATKDRIEREIQLEEWKFDKLINDEEYYAELRKDIISGNISEVNDLMIGFLDDFESYNESTIKGIESSWQDLLNQIHRIKEAQREIYNMPSEPSKPKTSSSSSSSPSSSSKSSSSSSGSSSSSSSSSSRTGGDPMRIPGTNKYIAEVKQPNGDWTTVLIEDGKVIDRHKLKDGSIIYTFGGAYRYDSKTNKGQILHDGGWVGNTKLKKDEIPAILQEGEYVLSKKMLENISNISKAKVPNPIIDIPKISNASSNNPIEFKIGNLIKIEGNADEKILPELNRAADSVMDRLKKDLNMSGIYRPMKV